jgi:phosphoglycolate phosphatase
VSVPLAGGAGGAGGAGSGGAPAMRCLYLDLDSTLLGRGASMLHDGEGNVTIDGVRAVQACLRAGVEVVLMSGRRRAQVAEDARLLGQSSYIYEAGACLVLDGEEHWLTGELLPGELSIAEQIERSGAPALLLERYAGRLEYHEPWHTEREVSHLFRGLVDALEVDRVLAEHGHGNLRLVDNGVVSRRSPALAQLPHVRGYHLVPAGAAKAGAVALHRRARGYERAQSFGVGDSREDLACARELHAFWLVANALSRDPSLREALGAFANVRVCEKGHGPGVYEAVVSTLMGAADA